MGGGTASKVFKFLYETKVIEFRQVQISNMINISMVALVLRDASEDVKKEINEMGGLELEALQKRM